MPGMDDEREHRSRVLDFVLSGNAVEWVHRPATSAVVAASDYCDTPMPAKVKGGLLRALDRGVALPTNLGALVCRGGRRSQGCASAPFRATKELPI